MPDYLYIYRDTFPPMQNLSAEEKGAMMQKWGEWFGKLKNAGVLVDMGGHLSPKDAKVITSDGITDGAIKNSDDRVLMGYTVVKAENIDEAVELAKDCPGPSHGCLVEVREKMTSNN